LNTIDGQDGMEFLHLVCVSFDDKVYWLNDNSDTKALLLALKSCEGDAIIAHSASLAEIPCCIKLGVEVDKYLWICTETLYKYINHIKQGTQGNEIKTSLIECLNNYGLGAGFTSTEEKDKWRNIILTKDVEQYKHDIIRYCASDTGELEKLFNAEIKELNQLTKGDCLLCEFDPDNFTCKINKKDHKIEFPYNDPPRQFDLEKFLKSESENHIAVAKMYIEGYDADPYLIQHLQDWRYLDEIKKMINQQIPGLFDEKGHRKDEVLEQWIFNNVKGSKEWWEKGTHKDGEIKSKTPTGNFSFSDKVIDYFCEEFENNEELEKYRVLRKLVQAVQGLARGPEDNKGWYYPNLYSDGMHCHANEHGANTTRFGNKSRGGHIPSWSKSLRSCLKPSNPNEVYFSLDFNAQEMWIVGQMSKDYTLLDTYEAQDVYMKMAQQMNLYPKNLPIPTEEQRKEDWFKPYKKIRKDIKGVNLGMNYGMSPATYAKRNEIEISQAEEYWEMFAKAFSNKTTWGKVLQYYYVGNPIKNKETNKVEGWEPGCKILIGKEQIITRFRETNFRTNYNKQLRQILNFPIQCFGAQITRRAIRYAQKEGLKPFLPVHDEIYFKTTNDKLEHDIEVARDCMKRAASDCFENPLPQYPIKVGEAELYLPGEGKYTVHEGAEERFEQILSICKKLDEMGPAGPSPKQLEQMEKEKKKAEKERKKLEKELAKKNKPNKRKQKKKESETVENTMEDFFE